MRDTQIALEEKNMKQTSMSEFMDGLDEYKSCELLVDLAEKVEGGIRTHHDNTQRKRSPFFKMTEGIEFSDLAYIGLKSVIGTMSVSASMAVTLLGTNIGNDILIAAGREEDTFSIEDEMVTSKVTAGITLLDIVLNSFPKGLLRAAPERLSKTVTQWTVSTTKKFDSIVEENAEMFSHFTKKMMPMVCEPDDWMSVYGGGYLTETSKKLTPLVKRNIHHAAPTGSVILESINHLQKTPFRVNKAVFEICKQLQGLRPEEMKKVFRAKADKFDEPCPIDKEEDSYLWEKIEGEKENKKTGKVRKTMVMAHQCEDSIAKRKSFFKWAARKDLHKQKEEARKSLNRSYTTCMALTEELVEYEDIYWAYQLDRRSRVYPAAMTGINLQGADYQKAVVEFSIGLPLDFDGDGEGGEYAMIKTLCNHWGQDSGNGVKTDKLTRKAAEEWMQGASAWIIDCARNPLESRAWMSAGKPLQFYAAAIEWANWRAYRLLHNDYGFISHLCDPNDASCSGAQILSAMTRDEVGAMHTNLMNLDVQDLYMAVAHKVADNLVTVFLEDTMAQDWLGRSDILSAIDSILRGDGHEILTEETQQKIVDLSSSGMDNDEIFLSVYLQMTSVEQARMSMIIRDLVKKPVMVKFYSGTRYGNIEHCSNFIVESSWEDLFRCDGTGKAAAYMGNLIFDSINQVIAGAGVVMEWFVHVADVIGGSNQAVHWDTPAGFPASMKKFVTTDKQLRIKFQGDELRKFTLKLPIMIVQEDGTKVYKLDVGKMKSGIAPDIVHSLDASLIMLVAARCALEGIQNLWMVHDSLASHCCYSGRFNRIIREEFIKMFETDILENMYQKFLGQLPEGDRCLLMSPTVFGIKRGSYNLEEVLDSQFCFK